MRLSSTRFISIAGTEVHAAVTNAADGKTALKEIKQKKSEFALKRRALLYQQKQAKAAADKAEGAPTRRKSPGMFARIARLFGKARAVIADEQIAAARQQHATADDEHQRDCGGERAGGGNLHHPLYEAGHGKLLPRHYEGGFVGHRWPPAVSPRTI